MLGHAAMNQRTASRANNENGHDNRYFDFYQRYVDEAAFLWLLRSVAIHQPHYNKDDIAELEARIQAQLDGLMSSIDHGWQACEAALAIEESGEIFTAAVTAFRSHEVKKIKQVVEAALVNDQATCGLVSALGWISPALATPWIEKLLISKELNHKYLGLAACSVRRLDPGDDLAKILARDDCQKQTTLYLRALRLVGELRRQDLMPELIKAMKSDNPAILFWSSWSAILLGNRAAVSQLAPYLLKEGPYLQRAIEIVFRVLTIEQARQTITAMAKIPSLNRAVIQASATLGDPHAVNWLIQKMRDPAVAKLAGEAFTLITGLDLTHQGLNQARRPVGETIPSDDPSDENIAMDEDENLPWPDADKVTQCWQQHGRHFIIGQRYFMGQAISSDWLLKQLEHTRQRQRHAAALELALIDPSHPLYNTQGRVEIQ